MVAMGEAPARRHLPTNSTAAKFVYDTVFLSYAALTLFSGFHQIITTWYLGAMPPVY
jgi:hypothetical protein